MFRPIALAIAAALIAGCGSDTDQPPGNDPQPSPAPAPAPTPAPTPSPTACSADPAWFPVTAFPDGNAFPNSNNCDFHQWSWQMFLWLREPASTEPGSALNFETFANPNAVLRPGGPGDTPYPGRTADQGSQMLARAAKSASTVDADDIFQAGAGNRILIDQVGNVVYYTGLLNQTFWDFVVDNQLYDLSALQSIASGTDFPVNTIELKVSWRIAATYDSTGALETTYIANADSQFYTTRATVPVVEVVDGTITDNTGKTQDALLAMVGMHVVGVVKDHPEFIWATFEHKANAPDCAVLPAGATNSGTGLPWSFYTPNTPVTVQNQFDGNTPLAVVSICRQVPWGGGDDQNIANIQNLNASVAPHLAGTVWANYQLIGAVWTTGDDDIPGPNGAPMQAGDRQLGSLDLANTTMETFTQDANCFACHNGGVHTVTVTGGNQPPSGQIVAAKHLDLSHFIVNYQAAQQAASGSE